MTAGASSSVRVRRSAPTRAIAFALPLLLTGCPALLSDWTVSGSGSGPADASVDGSGSGAGGASSGSSGGSPSGGSAGSSSGGSGGATGSGGLASGGSSSDGATGTGGTVTCTLVTHSNGIGQTWQDCVPLATYNESQAMKACKASSAVSCSVVPACGPSLPEVRGYSADNSIGGRWGYVGSLAGYVGTGTRGELCFGANDPNNRTWGGAPGCTTGACPPCASDLSNVGTGDFRIDLDVSGVLGATPYALVNQRASCPPYNGWALYTSSTGAVELETNNGNSANRVFQIGGTGVNDGNAHHIAAWRSAGRIYVQVDATPTSPAVVDTNALGSLPPLVIGSDACTTAAAPLTGSLTGLCILATPVCLTDLSGVGTGDFSIHFTLTTTETGLTLALVNQRTGCDQSSTFWDVTLSPTAGIVAATSDGIAAHYVFVEAGNGLNDGKPHKVDVIRRGGLLWYASDGVIHSAQTPDPYAFGTFPPLVLGSSACAGTTPPAGHATISEVCITEP